MRRCYLLLLIWLLCLPPGHANVDFIPPALSQLIKKHRINPKNIGFVLQREDGLVIAAHQAERLFNPASVTKIITSLAALDILGADFNWQTTIAKTGAIKNGVLNGDLYLIGGGDPYLTLDNFLYLLNDLRSQGLKEIRGNLVIDDTFFVLPPHNPAAFDGVPTRPYNVGGGGLVVNFKAQRVVFQPVGSRVHVYTDPPNTNFKIDNRIKLSKRRCRNWRGRIREQLLGDDQHITLRLSGSYSKHCKQQAFHLSVLSHPAYVAGVFGGLWQRLGGVWSGQWRQGRAPEKISTLLVHDSQPLPLVLSAMNKFSNNVIARNVYLSLAAGNGTPPPYRPQHAEAVMRRWLAEKGVPEVVVENGSGLSRKARISPAQMTHLLNAIWRHPYRPELIASLPILGKDGTLRKRFRKNEAPAGNGHLKTGSLSGVITISGFFRDRKGDYFLLTLFSEKQSRRSVHRLQDDMIKWVYHLDA